MRALLALPLLASACASGSLLGTESGPDTVRERLDKPTRLYIGATGSTGSVTASRWTHDGWIDGTSPLTITNGELVAKVDQAGNLTVTNFEVGVDPIDIPEAVFGKPAQLQNVRVTLASTPAPVSAQWASDDDATSAVPLDLELSWAIAIDGNITPLGNQHLPPITVDLGLVGDGSTVDATVGLHAMGDLWNWAGLLKLTDLQLDLAGETVN